MGRRFLSYTVLREHRWHLVRRLLNFAAGIFSTPSRRRDRTLPFPLLKYCSASVSVANIGESRTVCALIEKEMEKNYTWEHGRHIMGRVFAQDIG